MTVKVLYHGPGHVLRVAGREIPRGSEAFLPGEVAEQLLADPAYHVDVVGEVARPAVEAPPKTGFGSGRAAWQEYAVAIGVPVTNYMSRDEIVAAVEAAVGGESFNPNNEEED